MKTIILLLVLITTVVWAGTFTVTVPSAVDARVDAAVRAIQGLDHNPSNAEVAAFLRDYLKNTVLDYERRQNIAQFTPAPFFTPTPTPTP